MRYKVFRTLKLMVGLTMGLCSFHATPVHADDITLVADEWCPYNCVADSDKPGWMIELAQKILTKAGHSVTYRVVPWTRAIAEARRGVFTGIVGAAKSDAPDFVFPEVAFGGSGFSLFVKSGNPWRYTGLESLKGQVVGAIRDYSYGEPIDSYLKENSGKEDLVQFVGGETGLKTSVAKLLRGRVSTVVEDAMVMAHYLKSSGLAHEVTEAGQGRRQPVYVAFSPSHPKAKEYAALMSDGIRAMQKSGEYDSIRAKYGITADENRS